MKPITRIAILLTGAVGASTIVYLIFSSLYAETQSELLEKWRSISPGEHISVVKERYGAENYFVASGEILDAFKDSPALLEYKKTHRVYVYTIDGFGPQLLYVFTDKNDIVTFVVSRPT